MGLRKTVDIEQSKSGLSLLQGLLVLGLVGLIIAIVVANFI